MHFVPSILKKYSFLYPVPLLMSMYLALAAEKDIECAVSTVFGFGGVGFEDEGV
jgi:hypothetical protein